MGAGRVRFTRDRIHTAGPLLALDDRPLSGRLFNVVVSSRPAHPSECARRYLRLQHMGASHRRRGVPVAGTSCIVRMSWPDWNRWVAKQCSVRGVAGSRVIAFERIGHEDAAATLRPIYVGDMPIHRTDDAPPSAIAYARLQSEWRGWV